MPTHRQEGRWSSNLNAARSRDLGHIVPQLTRWDQGPPQRDASRKPTSVSVRIVRYHRGLRVGVVALLRYLAPGDDAFRDAYFRWKHENNPFVREPIFYVALDGERVVGMRGFHGASWYLDAGEPSMLLCACDLVVDPSYRGRGLNRSIMDAAFSGLHQEGHRTVLSFSANPITYAESLRIGWRLAIDYGMLAIETRRAQEVRRAASRLSKLPAVWRWKDLPGRVLLRRGFSDFDRRWRKGHADLGFALEARPEAMARIAGATAPRGIRHVRDAIYYRWRFQNPASEYRFVYSPREAPNAFLVLQRPRFGAGADVSIVDHAAPDANTLIAMIDRVIDVGGFDCLSVWGASVPPAVAEALASRRFAARDMSRGDPRYQPGLLTYDLDGAALRDSRRSWDLRMIDSDYY